MKKIYGMALALGVSVAISGCGKSQEEIAAEVARQRAAELAKVEAEVRAKEEEATARKQREAEEARRQEELARQEEAERRLQEEQSRIDALKVKVTELLKDPESAQFKDVALTPGGALCGEVNARNSFGGYVGFKRFVATDEKAFIDGTDALEHLVYQTTAQSKGCE